MILGNHGSQRAKPKSSVQELCCAVWWRGRTRVYPAVQAQALDESQMHSPSMWVSLSLPLGPILSPLIVGPFSMDHSFYRH